MKNEQTGNQLLNKQFNRLPGNGRTTGEERLEQQLRHLPHHRLPDRGSGQDDRQDSQRANLEMNIGCEACHGPGENIYRRKADKQKTVFNPARVRRPRAVNGLRVLPHPGRERKMHSTQGNPEKTSLPQAGTVTRQVTTGPNGTASSSPESSRTSLSRDYKGDLKGMFMTDDYAKANKVFEEAKHHQEYQGFIQSRPLKAAKLLHHLSRTPRREGQAEESARACLHKCHDASYTVEKYMPNTGRTARSYLYALIPLARTRARVVPEHRTCALPITTNKCPESGQGRRG